MFTIQSYKLVTGAQYTTLLHEPDRKTKWLRVLIMRPGKALCMEKILACELEHMRQIEHKSKPYPLKRALKIFRRFAKSHGANKSAKSFLKEATV